MIVVRVFWSSFCLLSVKAEIGNGSRAPYIEWANSSFTHLYAGEEKKGKSTKTTKSIRQDTVCLRESSSYVYQLPA